MSSPAAAPVVDAPTFWESLPGGHRVALFAAPFALAGSLGPVLDGTTLSGGLGVAPRAVALHGYHGAGIVGVLAALAALVTLVVVKDRQKRSSRAMVFFLVAAAWPVLVFLSNGYVLNGTGNTGSWQWGPGVAMAASLVGLVGALVGSRDPDQKPTY